MTVIIYVIHINTSTKDTNITGINREVEENRRNRSINFKVKGKLFLMPISASIPVYSVL